MAQAIAHADVLLTWTDNSDDENGFMIERTLSPNCSGGWGVIGYTGANQHSFTDIQIPGACYRVAAYNENGLSAYSNTAQVAQTPASQTPTPQPNLTMPADYANSVNTTSNSTPQNAPAIQESESPGLQSAATRPTKPELRRATATDRVKVPAKLDPIARPLIIRPPQSGKLNKTWSVQVSATPAKEIANGLAQQLKSEGYSVYIIQAEVKGQTYHRVRIGPFSAREQAESVRQSLARHESYRDAFLATD